MLCESVFAEAPTLLQEARFLGDTLRAAPLFLQELVFVAAPVIAQDLLLEGAPALLQRLLSVELVF